MNTSNPKQAILRKAKKFAIWCVIVGAIILPVRLCVAMTVRETTSAVSPEIPQGSFVLVYRLASDFKPGDIVLCRIESGFRLARCEAVSGSVLHVSRFDQHLDVPRNEIIGKIILATR
jgi:hypothetical protein